MLFLQPIRRPKQSQKCLLRHFRVCPGETACDCCISHSCSSRHHFCQFFLQTRRRSTLTRLRDAIRQSLASAPNYTAFDNLRVHALDQGLLYKGSLVGYTKTQLLAPDSSYVEKGVIALGYVTPVVPSITGCAVFKVHSRPGCVPSPANICR
jgi:hypothetical protein